MLPTNIWSKVVGRWSRLRARSFFCKESFYSVEAAAFFFLSIQCASLVCATCGSTPWSWCSCAALSRRCLCPPRKAKVKKCPNRQQVMWSLLLPRPRITRGTTRTSISWAMMSPLVTTVLKCGDWDSLTLVIRMQSLICSIISVIKKVLLVVYEETIVCFYGWQSVLFMWKWTTPSSMERRILWKFMWFDESQFICRFWEKIWSHSNSTFEYCDYC